MEVKYDDMKNNYCPFVEETCLLEKCIHFQEEAALVIETYVHEYGTVNIRMSSCRLWRD